MEVLLSALEATWWAQSLRSARWGYAMVSAAHVLGIALLVGAILPLDLRLLGLWRTIAHETIARVLVPMAIAGLVLALASGFLLFAVRATEYGAVGIVWLKLSLIVAGASSALIAHRRHGIWLSAVGPRQSALVGSISLACWIGALLCGRLIAFVGS